ncbi:hypothetical protein REPUB_Repub12eG0206300 [Reevesia pubescens]
MFSPFGPGNFVPLFASTTSPVQHGFMLIPGIVHPVPPAVPKVLPTTNNNHNNNNDDINMEEFGSNNSFDEDLYDDDDSDLFDDIDYYEIYNDSATSRMKPASKTTIEGLEKVVIDESFGTGVQCAVCLEELLIGSEARRLCCSHFYHPNCIVQWLNTSNMCPVCRLKLPVVDFNLNFLPPVVDINSLPPVVDFDLNSPSPAN